ncbi:tyrosine-type recombinase/integrase [Flavobacterium sp. CS20]|uniref:tyrosine-type recombinase/integrase n=1 Tax=Flavobacterium sp. CS20 TaxID=2775246 RepID=UPI001B3A088B|nr:tyrosine-type recombinase/integrase [Flavobacterium sp. CS20]QTY27578.1 tyrosine-type recombinase/integrase [Flavobacterium sp. CS20]
MKLKEYLQQEHSPTSINSYELMINRYILAMGDKAEKGTYTDVLDYIGLLREQNLHPKSLRNNLFAIKIYYRYLVATGKRNDHPCRYLYLKDQINRAIQVESLYPKEILEELYENHQSKNPDNQNRDKIIISLLIYQALAVLEISQLKTTDIDLENGIIRIKGNVKNKGRTLSLKPNQILLFHNYLKHDYKRYHRRQKPSKRKDYFLLNDEGLQLWQSGINRMINKERDQQEKLIPLKIRQSVIAHLLKENNDVRIVQEFAGHRRATSTEAYKQTGLEELKSAIERLHPLQ